MVFKKPTDVTELVYHTQRPLSRKGEKDESGFCHMWVFKPDCECGGKMSKPKRKAKEFVCDKCGKEVLVDDIQLVAMAEYDCPYCHGHSEFEQDWVRNKSGDKKFKFKCAKCDKQLEVTKLK